MERILGALMLIALVGVPFWFSRRKKMHLVENWNNERKTPYVGQGAATNPDISSGNAHTDGSHH